MIKLSVTKDIYLNDTTQLDAHINTMVASGEMPKDVGTGIKLNGYATQLIKTNTMPTAAMYSVIEIPQLQSGVKR